MSGLSSSASVSCDWSLLSWSLPLWTPFELGVTEPYTVAVKGTVLSFHLAKLSVFSKVIYSTCLSDTTFSVSCKYSLNHIHFPCSIPHSVVKRLNAYSMIGSELRNKDSKDQFYALVLESECLFKYFLCFNLIPGTVRTFACPRWGWWLWGVTDTLKKWLR